MPRPLLEIHIIQRILNIGNYLIEIVSSMFCVLIKNNEIAHFITSAIHFEIQLIGANGFCNQNAYLQRNSSQRQAISIDFVRFGTTLEFLFSSAYMCKSFDLTLSLHFLLLSLFFSFSMAHPNWLRFCSFARHFQCGCFIWIVLCLLLHTHTDIHRFTTYAAVVLHMSFFFLYLFHIDIYAIVCCSFICYVIR